MLWYYELANWHGKFTPRTATMKPDVVTINGVTREKKADSIGARIRAITLVNPGLVDRDLRQLREVYSPEGRFYDHRSAA